MNHPADTDRAIPWIARMLLDTGTAGVALLEGTGFVHAYVNASYQAVAPERAMLGRPFGQVWPELAPRLLPLLERVRESGEPFEGREWRLDLRREGRIDPAWFSFRLHAVPARAGDPAAVAAHVVDRTAAVLARAREDELRVERERLLDVEHAVRAAEQLAEAIPQLVWTADPAGNGDWFNRHWTEFTGLDAETSRGRAWQGVVHPDDAARAAARWALSVSSGEPFEVEYRLRRFDGAYRWHLARSAPLRGQEGTILKWFGTCTDIDDQKRAEEQIHLARRRAEDAAFAAATRAAEMDAILDAIATGLVLHDREGRIVRTNAAAERIFGFAASDRDATPEQRSRRFRAFGKDGRPVPPAELPSMRALRGEEVGPVEFRLERDGAAAAWVSAAAAPIRDAAGALHGAVSTFSDVTAMHVMLTVIAAQVQMLQRKPDDREVVLRRAGSIRTSAGRMATMIEDLVDVVRLEAGQVTIRPRAVDVAPFAAELRERLRGALAVERLRLELPEGLPRAWADPARLERILVNLITNALKYSPPETETVLSAERRDGVLRLSVVDRGPGIAPDEVPRIFERFYRSPSTASRQDGLGLGLYVTRLLVEAHGGTIAVESALGRGSAFHVHLPTAPG
jgi:PAS domain S-box-containing protein